MTRGIPFLGRKVERCPVVYVDAEMYPTDPIDREVPYLERWGDADVNYFHMLNFSFQDKQQFQDLASEEGQQKIKNYLIKVEKLTGKKPLLVLDNLRSLSSYKKNDSDAWYPIGRFLFKLRGSGFPSIVVDHMGKMSPGPRGSSSKTDWADLVLVLSPEREKGSKLMKVKVAFDKARGLRPENTDEFFAQYDFQGEWTVVEGAKELSKEEEMHKISDIVQEWVDGRHEQYPNLTDEQQTNMSQKDQDKYYKRKFPNGSRMPVQEYIAIKFGCSVGKINKLIKKWNKWIVNESREGSGAE